VLSLNYLKLYRFEREMAFPIQMGVPAAGFSVDARYRLDQSGSLSVLAPAIGLEVTDRLALGLTLNIWNDDITGASEFTKTEHERGTVHFDGANDYAILTENTYEVRSGYSVVLGALYRASKEWTLGAVVKPPFVLDLNHAWSNWYEDRYTPKSFVETEQDAELEMPLVVGAGVAWRPSDPLTVSADATWTQWSEFNLREKGQDLNPLTNLHADAGECQDAITGRLGAEYLLIFPSCMVPLRCGLGYDPGPSVDQTDTFYTASVGSGLQMGRYAFDTAYQVRWGRGVYSAVYPEAWGSSEDVLQHRVLASLIVYF
jgi:long-subunit fatty acid transport protein